MSNAKEQPIRIFDSRLAKGVYVNDNYIRSQSFNVPPGYVAVIELTTHYTFLPTITFTAIRIPPLFTANQCFNDSCLGKRYRRWRCYQGLGEDLPNTQMDPFNQSVVRWGNDAIRGELVEHEYIVRPGQYYLIADKCNNENLLDCTKPTILDMSLMKVDQFPELLLPGCLPE